MIYIVSPHIDDALLSLGGFIAELLKEKYQVNIQYIFTISQWTNPEAISKLGYEKDNSVITNLRKDEEISIARHLGYDFEFLDFYDLPLRYKNTSANELVMIKEITERLKNKFTKDDQIFFPLGFDHHDHIIINNIGMHFKAEGYQVFLYEDLPYAAMGKHNHISHYNQLYTDGFEPVMVPIDIEAKIELLKRYASQMSYTWLNNIRTYAYSLNENKFYERYWRPAGKQIKL